MTLAIDGGTPVRSTLLPYARHDISPADISAVTRVLMSDHLTQGPAVEAFEAALRKTTGATNAIVMSSGTAALHAVMFALNIQPRDEIIVPPLTFISTINCILARGAIPVFADIDPNSWLIDWHMVESKITSKTKAIIAVDYAGAPCDYDALTIIAQRRNIFVIADACHSLGAKYKAFNVGTLADASIFSFHPAKAITTGEGGAVIAHNDIADLCSDFRDHGITSRRNHHYTIDYMGYNYRMPDINAALGQSQLSRLEQNIRDRNIIASEYNTAFRDLEGIDTQFIDYSICHAYHLYPIVLSAHYFRVDRDAIYRAFRAENIGVAIHYDLVYKHKYLNSKYNTTDCPIAEYVASNILSLPIFPSMSNNDVSDVIDATHKVIKAYKK